MTVVPTGLANPGLTASPSAARFLRTLRRAGLLLVGVVPIAFISTSICYLLLYITPINAADEILGAAGTPAQIHKLAVQLGTNKSFFAQYGSWLTNVLHGNFGTSYFTRIPVGTSIVQRFPVDLSIAVLAILISLTLGFSGGILAATRQGGIIDKLVTIVCSIAHAIPEFWSGILLVLVFAVAFRALPATGWVAPSQDLWGWFTHAIMPAFSLSIVPAAGIARQLRTSLVGVMGENFVIGARVRGLGPKRVLFRHALRNGAGPAIAAFGLHIPSLVGGAVIAETVFGLPGLGQFVLLGAQDKDMPVVQGVLVVLIVVVLAANLVVNVALDWLHPQARRSR